MKKLLVIICVGVSTAVVSQPVRVHLMGGFANYNGDLQAKRFTLQQARGVAGAGVTYDLSNHLSGRATLSYGQVGADDKRSSSPNLIARNLNFNSKIFEAALLGEYNFKNLNEHKLSPYVFLGVGIFAYNPYTYDAGGNKVFLYRLSTEGQGIIGGRKYYKRIDLNIPMGGGVKYALSDDIRLGFEIGLRVTKTDHVDDVSTTYIDQNTLFAERGQQAVDFAFRGDELKNNPTTYPVAGSIRGNGKVNDFYYFGVFRIDFRLNWFDNGGGGSRSKLGCPTTF